MNALEENNGTSGGWFSSYFFFLDGAAASGAEQLPWEEGSITTLAYVARAVTAKMPREVRKMRGTTSFRWLHHG
jgi:hypothetical protein